MYTYHTQIFMHNTDAAGRLYFANQFYFMHEAKEKMLEKIGLPLHEMMSLPDITFPIVHAAADFKSVLVLGDKIAIDVHVEKIGETSIVFAFTIKKADGTVAGTGKSVSVCMSTKTQKKVPIPDKWRERMTKALS